MTFIRRLFVFCVRAFKIDIIWLVSVADEKQITTSIR